MDEQRLRAATDSDHTRGVQPYRFGRRDRGRTISARRGRRLRRLCVVVTERDECDHGHHGHAHGAQDATATTRQSQDARLVAVNRRQH